MISDIYYSKSLQELIKKNGLGHETIPWAINVQLFGALSWGKLTSRATESVGVYIFGKIIYYKFLQHDMKLFYRFVNSLTIKKIEKGVTYGHIIEIMTVLKGFAGINNPAISEIIGMYDSLCHSCDICDYRDNNDILRDLYNTGIEYFLTERMRKHENTINALNDEINQLQSKITNMQVNYATSLIETSKSFDEILGQNAQRIISLTHEINDLGRLNDNLIRQRSDYISVESLICYKIPIKTSDELLALEFRGGKLDGKSSKFIESNLTDEFIYYLTDGYDKRFDEYYYKTYPKRDVLVDFVDSLGSTLVVDFPNSRMKGIIYNFIRVEDSRTIISFDDITRLLGCTNEFIQEVIKKSSTKK